MYNDKQIMVLLTRVDQLASYIFGILSLFFVVIALAFVIKNRYKLNTIYLIGLALLLGDITMAILNITDVFNSLQTIIYVLVCAAPFLFGALLTAYGCFLIYKKNSQLVIMKEEK